jgi:hypothetical protein
MGERLPKKAIGWISPERRKRIRPESSGMHNIRRAMNEMKLQDEHCQDGVRWRKGLEIRHHRQTP